MCLEMKEFALIYMLLSKAEPEDAERRPPPVDFPEPDGLELKIFLEPGVGATCWKFWK